MSAARRLSVGPAPPYPGCGESRRGQRTRPGDDLPPDLTAGEAARADLQVQLVMEERPDLIAGEVRSAREEPLWRPGEGHPEEGGGVLPCRGRAVDRDPLHGPEQALVPAHHQQFASCLA